MTHALVIGAGVAGPVLAMALQRVGIQATVFERDPQGAEQRGAWLTFQANGIDALAAIDADAAVRRLGFGVETIRFINGKGRSLGRMPMAAPRDDGQLSLMMRRADLYSALAALARQRGATVHHDKEFVDAVSTAGGVRALFADGTTAEGELLVGCDGIQSRVRRIIDPQAPAPRYVPVLNTGGYIPDFRLDVPPGEFRMQFGTRCFFAWTPTPDGGAVWFANPPMAHEPDRGVLSTMGDAHWRGWLHELMAGDAGPAHQIIDAAPGPLIGWATYDMPIVRHWRTSNMIIIGDAAHATAPSAGQGAAMALEDAVILAKCMRDCPDIRSGFSTFEALRRDRVQRIVKHGARSANSKAAGPIGRVIRDLMLPIVFKYAAKDGGQSMTWLQGHHIDFNEPISTVAAAMTARR
ncbi:MAG: FAD-dependent monooxygenase [Mycobacterium sp.]|nr:FAD-dependent monooxygenase [Mycobacterium sp.]MBV9721021.1 FAD-dependent monooxygenase [Mycobacterium sp.]